MWFDVVWELMSKNSFVRAFTAGLPLLFVGWLIRKPVRRYRAKQISGICKLVLKKIIGNSCLLYIGIPNLGVHSLK